jgi:hypothetical protein
MSVIQQQDCQPAGWQCLHMCHRKGSGDEQWGRNIVTAQPPTMVYIAQVVWAKGYTELVELLGKHAAREGSQPHIDCYGNGEDLADVAARAKAARLDLDMKGGIDHLDPSMHEYKVRAGAAVACVTTFWRWWTLTRCAGAWQR